MGVTGAIFVGDVHATDRTPASRRDNFGEAVLAKLHQVDMLAIELGIDNVIQIGDWYHSTTVGKEYENTMLGFMQSCSADWWVIPGNHDLPNHKMSRMNRSCLGTLLQAGVLRMLDRLKVGTELEIVGAGVDRERPVRNPKMAKSIYVGHEWWKNGYDEYVLTEEDAVGLGHDLYVLGHDHVPYVNQVIEREGRRMVVCRPGSLTRGTKHEHQMIRDVRVAVFTMKDGAGSLDFHYLNIEPAEAVFSAEASQPKAVQSKGVQRLIDKLKGHTFTGRGSVSEILDSINCDKRVRANVRERLEQEGVTD